jgi:hypothetical protein
MFEQVITNHKVNIFPVSSYEIRLVKIYILFFIRYFFVVII